MNTLPDTTDGLEIRGEGTSHVVMLVDGEDVLRLTKDGPEWCTDDYWTRSDAARDLLFSLRKHWAGKPPYERVGTNIWRTISLGIFVMVILGICIFAFSFSWIIWTQPIWEDIKTPPVEWQWFHQGLVAGVQLVIFIIWLVLMGFGWAFWDEVLNDG